MQHEGMSHYTWFAVNMVLSLIVMYFVMFSMIDGWSDFRNNLNMFYMALTMVAPMGVIMLLTMRGMYSRKLLNWVLHAVFTVVFIAALAATRQQSAIGDRQFIASMIPHHSGAILMCREARLTDLELIKLCEEIAGAQRREIEQMNAIRARLESRARNS
ncbi:DUF305 domain-containing protein [Hydrogenophaga sp.]|uniref:DUF305 domain-containing protein n=1 Tax=Hydrogenophaga sp. TaxID=1904254 RepID=UPI003429DAAC